MFSFLYRGARTAFMAACAFLMNCFSLEALPLLWQYGAPHDFGIHSVAAGSEGALYLLVARGSPGEMRLLALDPDRTLLWSRSVWKASPGSQAQAAATPLVDEQGVIHLAVGDPMNPAAGRLLAIAPDGSTQRETSLEGLPMRSPAQSLDKTIYLVLDGKHLDAHGADGARRWRFTVEGNITSSPVIGPDGTVYLGSGKDGFPREWTLHAIASDGAERWRYKSPDMVSTGAVGADGSLCFSTETGRLYMVNPDGALRWRLEFPRSFFGADLSPPVIGPDGTVYLTSLNQSAYAISYQGEIKWSFSSDVHMALTVVSPLVSADGTVYVCGSNNIVYALDPDGNLKAEREIPAYLQPFSLITEHGAYFYSGSALFALETSSGPAAGPWPMVGAQPGRTSRFSQTIAPYAPSEVTATLAGNGRSARIEWAEVVGLPVYEVWRSATDRLEDATLIASSIPELNHLDSLGMAGVTYAYWVRARTAVAVGEFSEPAMVSILPDGPGGLLWHFKDQQNLYPGGIALDGEGRIFAGNSDGTLFCFNPDGAMAWRFETGHSILSAPSIGADGGIYVGSVLVNDFSFFGSRPGSLFCLNPDGSLRWQYGTNGVAASVAIGVDGTVYAGTTGNRFMAIDPDGRLRWEYQRGPEYRPVLSAPVLFESGPVFFGALVAFSLEGELLWELPDAVMDVPSPALSGGMTVYAGDTTRGWRRGLSAYGLDGGLHWHIPSIAPSASPVLGLDGTMYLGLEDGRMMAFSNNQPQWSFQAGGRISSSPALDSGGNLYFGSDDGNLYCLDHEGSKRWELPLGSAVRGAVAIGPEGRVYVSADEGGLYVFQGYGPLAETDWPCSQGDSARSGLMRRSPAAPNAPQNVWASQGSVLGVAHLTWSSVPEAVAYEIRRGISDDLGAAEILVENLSGRPEFRDRTAVNGQSYYYWIRAKGLGQSSEFAPPVPGYHNTDARFVRLRGRMPSTPAIAPDGTLFLTLAESPPHRGARLTALDPEGNMIWEYVVPSPPLRSPPLLTAPVLGKDGTLYFGANDGRGFAVRPDGTLKWEFSTYWIVAPPALAENMVLFASKLDGFLYALDFDGTLLWKTDTKADYYSAPYIGVDETIYIFGYPNFLTALSPDGVIQWRQTLQLFPAFGMAFGEDGTLFAATYGRVAAYDGEQKRWENAFGFAAAPPVISADGALYLVNNQGAIHKVSADGEIAAVFQLENPDRVVTQLSLAGDGSLMAGTSGRTLLILNPDFSLKAEISMGQQHQPVSTPVIGPGGEVYLGADTGQFLVLQSDFRMPSRGWPTSRGYAAQTASWPTGTGPEPERLRMLPPQLTRDGRFVFEVKPGTRQAYLVEGSNDLIHWTPATEVKAITTPEILTFQVDPARPAFFFRLVESAEQ
jgi:outer membrane protein assembly factor BamB